MVKEYYTQPTDTKVLIPEEDQFYLRPQYMVFQDNQDYTSAVPAHKNVHYFDDIHKQDPSHINKIQDTSKFVLIQQFLASNQFHQRVFENKKNRRR